VRLTADDLDTLIDLCRLEASNTSSEDDQSVAIDLGHKLQEMRDGPDPLADIHNIAFDMLHSEPDRGDDHAALMKILELSKP